MAKTWKGWISLKGYRLFVLLGLLLSLSLSLWGLPSGSQVETSRSWAYDEISPIHAAKISSNLLKRALQPEQPALYVYPVLYPLALSIWESPVWAALWLTGGWHPSEVSKGFPYGLTHPRFALPLLSFWGRLSTWLLLAFLLVRVAKRNEWVAALLALSPFCLYYGSTNNLDFPPFVCLMGSLYYLGREKWIVASLLAALAVSLKDQYWVAAAVVPFLCAFLSRERVRTLFSAGLSACAAYLVLSFALWAPGIFREHVKVLLSNPTGDYYQYPKTVSGSFRLFLESSRQLGLSAGAGLLAFWAWIFLARGRVFREHGRWLVCLLVLAMAYWVGVVWVISYVYLRFTAPLLAIVCACLMIPGAPGTSGNPEPRRWAFLLAGLIQALLAVELLTQVWGDARLEAKERLAQGMGSRPLSILSIQGGDRMPFPGSPFRWIRLKPGFTREDLEAAARVKGERWVMIADSQFRRNRPKGFELILPDFCPKICDGPPMEFRSRSLLGGPDMIQSIGPDVWIAKLRD